MKLSELLQSLDRDIKAFKSTGKVDDANLDYTAKIGAFVLLEIAGKRVQADIEDPDYETIKNYTRRQRAVFFLQRRIRQIKDYQAQDKSLAVNARKERLINGYLKVLDIVEAMSEEDWKQ